MSNIGNIIKDKRLSQNLSLDELGELINVGKSTISKWENGSAVPDLAVLDLVAKAMKVNPFDLVKFV